jgi:thiosulfate/3-mercaptopyruvate sulfurtransferase
LIDCRPAEEFAGGHIQGAVHFDLFGLSLIDTTPSPLRAFMTMMRHLFELRGVDRAKKVVFYEEDSGMRAARGVWFLEFFGHGDVRLLDGGIRAWARAGYPLTTEVVSPKPGRLGGEENPDVLATVDQVLSCLNQPTVTLLDARSDDEYFGRHVRAVRGGAIPGAVHLEWVNNLDVNGRFKDTAELAAMYRGLGLAPEKEVVVYCQGGYRSAHTYLALRLIGYPRVRNYLGSWKEWGDRLDLPIEKPWDRK